MIDHRRALGLSVAGLARAVGIRRESLAYWLLGHRDFDADTLPALLSPWACGSPRPARSAKAR